MNFFKRIARLFVVAVITFIVCKATGFGWKFWSPPPSFVMQDDNKLEQRLNLHVCKLSDEI